VKPRWKAVTGPFRDLVSVVGAYRNWPTYLAHHFGLARQREMEIELRRYNVHVRSPGRGYEFHSLYCMMFEDDEYRLQRYNLPAGSTIIDIGAHIGWFTLSAFAQVAEARVFSYEPHPENYRLLAENLRLNGVSRGQAFQMAVAGEAGEALLVTSDHLGGLSTAGSLLADKLYAGHAPKQSHKVRTTTLDEIVSVNRIERCALLKIDCEGAEHAILASASPDTLARIERLSIEWDDLDEERCKGSLVALLEARGFSVETGGRWWSILYAISESRQPHRR
jgi:FkbM family methyltransferase